MDTGRRAHAAHKAVADEPSLAVHLLDAAPDAIVAVDPAGVIVLVNRQVEALFGYRRDELVGQRVELLLPERLRAGHAGLRSGYADAPAVRPMGRGQVLHARRKDGTEFPAEISLSPVRTDDGLLVATAIRDITERQRAAAEQARFLSQAEAAEAKFRGLLEAAPDGVVIAGPNGRIVLVNRQVEQMFGYDRLELAGQPVEQLIPPRLHERHARYRAVFQDAPRARPMGASLELFGRRKDGSEFPVEISLSPVQTQDGPLVSAAIRDISGRQQIEAAVRRQAALLQLVPAAVIVRDARDAVVSWNRAAEEQYGWTESDARGQVTHTLLRTRFPATKEAVDMELERTGYWEGQLTHTRADGSTLVVASRQAVQRDPLGQRTAVLEINTDVTDRQAAEEELRRLAADLARSNAELEQFAYVASHDLQEPLRMVGSYTTLLARRYRGRLDEDADDFIGFAVDGAARMQALIDGLLLYSRVGSHPLSLTPTNTGVVLDQALMDLGAAIADAKAVVTRGSLPALPTDPTQLRQLLQNLIANAIKFRGARPPEVDVSAERRGADWVFAVRDRGIGIEPQHLERIFLIFQRLHTVNEFPGTGIGLAVCKRIVERLGGRLWVESVPGQGTTFFFSLPADGHPRG